MKRALVLLILVLSPLTVHAQPQVIWSRDLGFAYYGEPVFSQGVMMAADDTGIYLLGIMGNQSQSTPISLFLAKFNNQGELLWQVTRPLTDQYYLYKWPVTMDVTDSHVYVAAAFWYLNEGISSIYLGKVNKYTGSMEYEGLKLLQPEEPGVMVYPVGIKVRREGGTDSIYLVGDAYKPFSPTIFIAKLVDDGRTFHLEWSKMIAHKFDLYPYGQNPRSIIFSDEGMYVTGECAPVTGAAPRGLVVRFDWQGNPVWAMDILYSTDYYHLIYIFPQGFLPSPTPDRLYVLFELHNLSSPNEPPKTFIASIYRDGTGGEVYRADGLNYSYMFNNLQVILPHPIAGLFAGSDPMNAWSFVGSFNGTGLEHAFRFEGDYLPLLNDALYRGDALYIAGAAIGEHIGDLTILPTEMDFGLTPVDKPMISSRVVVMQDFSLRIVEPTLSGYDPSMISYSEELATGAFLARIGEMVNVSILVSPVDAGETDPPVGSYTFVRGDTLILRADPSEGYEFDHWEVDGGYAGNSLELTLTLESDHEIVAHFKEIEEKREEIAPPSPCQLAFMRFPSDFRFKAASSDEKFNRDLLSSMGGSTSASGQRLHRVVILGGPAVVPFNWGSLGIRFLRMRGSYNGLKIPSGEVLISHYGKEDYAIIYRDCWRGVIRIAGITRFGTRAGLMWLLNNVETFYSKSSLLLVTWRDLNGDGEVELWEVEVEDL